MKVDGRNYDETGSTNALRCISRVDISKKKVLWKERRLVSDYFDPSAIISINDACRKRLRASPTYSNNIAQIEFAVGQIRGLPWFVGPLCLLVRVSCY